MCPYMPTCIHVYVYEPFPVLHIYVYMQAYMYVTLLHNNVRNYLYHVTGLENTEITKIQ